MLNYANLFKEMGGKVTINYYKCLKSHFTPYHSTGASTLGIMSSNWQQFSRCLEEMSLLKVLCKDL